MQAASTKKAGRKAVARSRVTNGADVLPNTDGRSAVVRRFRDILTAITSDQGGIERMSECRLQLVRRCSRSLSRRGNGSPTGPRRTDRHQRTRLIVLDTLSIGPKSWNQPFSAKYHSHLG